MKLIALLAASVLIGGSPCLRAASIPVTNANDSGPGSLRQAILAANAAPGPDSIVFSIGTGLQTITLASSLPTLTETVTIDATTQPGFTSAPLIELNGANTVSPGFQIAADNCVLRGFVINRCGFGIEIGGSVVPVTGSVIQGNYIGSDPAGAAARPNTYGIFITNARDTLIGGTTPGARNVISGNAGAGIWITGYLAVGNRVEGNFIGTTAAGTAALGNGGGVSLRDGTHGNTIGGTSAGTRNVISGHANFVGVYVGGNADLVQGNYVGTDVTGAVALPNSQGIYISGWDNLIGGAAAGAGNVVSGNITNGMKLETGIATGNTIQGNLIGLTAAGTAALGNGASGIEIRGASDNVVGGTAPGARNVISGNAQSGISIFFEAPRNVVQGNFIGTDITGTALLGNAGIGIVVLSAADNLIGGAAPGAGNVIAGNNANFQGYWGGVGIYGVESTGNRIQGNFIGTDPTGALDLGNRGWGVFFRQGGNNRVGGTGPGEGNIIAYNKNYGGVVVESGTGNAILSNSIFSNLWFMGIDLVNPGANNNQSPPELVSAVNTGAATTVQGVLHSAPATAFTLQFFDNPGGSQGETFLGSAAASTDASGNAPFSVVFPALLPPGHTVSATATDPAGNTSEFSSVAVTLPLLTINDVSVIEGVGAVFTVTLSPASDLPVTVDFSTADGSATAGADYGAVSGTLTFPAGTVTRPIAVPVIQDPLYEPDESFLVNLSGATNAAVADNQGAGTIVNDDPYPRLSINDAAATEGSKVTLTVTLSSGSGQPVTVNYATADGSAVAGSDYASASGTLTFPPGTLTRTIAVSLLKDGAPDAPETFVVNLSGAAGALLEDAQGQATILDVSGSAAAAGSRQQTAGYCGLLGVELLLPLAAGWWRRKLRRRRRGFNSEASSGTA